MIKSLGFSRGGEFLSLYFPISISVSIILSISVSISLSLSKVKIGNSSLYVPEVHISLSSGVEMFLKHNRNHVMTPVDFQRLVSVLCEFKELPLSFIQCYVHGSCSVKTS